MVEPQVHPIPFEVLRTAVLPLVAIAPDARWRPLGTAFVVSVQDGKQALLLTAAHNVRFACAIDSPRSGHHATALSEFLPKARAQLDLRNTYIHAILPLDTGWILTEMSRSWLLEGLDVALMSVAIPPHIDATFPTQFSLDTRPIEAGTAVMAVGYPGLYAGLTAPPDYEANRFEVRLDLCIEYRTGKVSQICPTGVGIHHWPGFLVDFPFDSGMSGGPVIDISGDTPVVRGLIGGDVSEVPTDGTRGSGAQAFASMLWPAMLIKTQLHLSKTAGAPPLTTDAHLLDLVQHGFIDDRGQAHCHIRLTETEASWC